MSDEVIMQTFMYRLIENLRMQNPNSKNIKIEFTKQINRHKFSTKAEE